MTDKPTVSPLRLRLQLLELNHETRKMSEHIRDLDNSLRSLYKSEQSYKLNELEIKKLRRLNRRLRKLELYLIDEAEKLKAALLTRIADPNDVLEDYEIEVTLYFQLREDDPEFDGHDDNFITKREFSVKHSVYHFGRESSDWREPCISKTEQLDGFPHCWLFHDLYDHEYGGPDKPALSLRDCSRINSIWVDIAVHHQATLLIDSGKWLQDIVMK